VKPATTLARDEVLAQARAIGFDLCGIAEARRHPKLQKLAEWIAAGRAGDMAYLGDSLGERLDPHSVLPTARSVVSLGVVYNSAPPAEDSVPAGEAIVSRYAWGDDYHDVVRARLTSLVRWMAERAGPGFEAFSCVDAGPVQERVFAEQAGLGWIGKNTCLINARVGSWIFLAEILTNAELDPDAPAVDQCGTCTRCLEACPTGAIVQPYEVDATRCLSYLTIETRDAVPAAWRDAIGARIYGCDICQDVCPWNRRAPESPDAAWQPRDAFRSASLVDLCRLSDDEWRALIRRSAMRRAGVRRIRRSLAYASRHLPASERAAALTALRDHPSGADPGVADAIAWSAANEDA
jgi:epoxyqueuosine reductase